MERPDFLPETHWDATSGAPNFEAVGKDYSELGALRTFKSEQEAARASLPKSPADYKFELPEGVEIPKELGTGFNTEDPDLKAFTALAHEEGLSQKAVSRILGMFVGMNAKGLAAEQDAMKAAETELHKSLGEKAKDRLTAGETWLKATDARKAEGYSPAVLQALGALLQSKDGVEALEAIIAGKGPRMAGLPNGNGKTGIDLSGLNPRQLLDHANATRN